MLLLWTDDVVIVVLTTTWVELMGDRDLHKVTRRAPTRDAKILSCVALVLGAFVARALLEYISDAGVLALGVGLRAAIAVGWVFVPAALPVPGVVVEKPREEV